MESPIRKMSIDNTARGMEFEDFVNPYQGTFQQGMPYMQQFQPPMQQHNSIQQSQMIQPSQQQFQPIHQQHAVHHQTPIHQPSPQHFPPLNQGYIYHPQAQIQQIPVTMVIRTQELD